MAIEALTCTGHVDHAPRHDLETILYVIIYICTFTNGPNLPCTENQLLKNLAICSWFKNDGMSSIGTSKIGHMQCAEQEILPNFTEYWTDFALFILDLIKACFPSRETLPNFLTYKGMINILSHAQDVVQETSQDKNCKSSQVVVGQKRQTQDMDPHHSKHSRRIVEHLDWGQVIVTFTLVSLGSWYVSIQVIFRIDSWQICPWRHICQMRLADKCRQVQVNKNMPHQCSGRPPLAALCWIVMSLLAIRIPLNYLLHLLFFDYCILLFFYCHMLVVLL